MKRLKYISLASFCVYMTAVILLCLIRTDSLPELPTYILGIPLDKVMHFLMFLPFPFLGYMAFYPAEKSVWRETAILLILCLLGAGFAFSTEKLQALTAYRSFEPADLLADFTGIISGAVPVIIQIYRRRR